MNDKKLNTPLKCWDIYAMHLINQAAEFTVKLELDILKGYKKKYGWLFDFEKLLCNSNYEAIVLTDANSNIEWTSKGFTKMTGYSASYSKGKRPSFLQGEKTSKHSIENIKRNLKRQDCTKETIINYKKNGDVYNCYIEFFPLKNNRNRITHFLALEKEVKFSS